MMKTNDERRTMNDDGDCNILLLRSSFFVLTEQSEVAS